MDNLSNAPGFRTDDDKKKKRCALFLVFSKTQISPDIRSLYQALPLTLNHTLSIMTHEVREIQKSLMERDISMVVMDYLFKESDEKRVLFAVEVKKLKPCPIFFLTRNEQALIQAYKKHMFTFQEADDYFRCPLDLQEATDIIKKTFSTENRIARRFKMNSEIKVKLLNDDTQEWEGVLEDMSLVGFGFRLKGDHVFLPFEQLNIRVSLKDHGSFKPHFGEFLRLSGSVRRISIEGKSVGCSIEHSNDRQMECLNHILEDVRSKRQAYLLLGQKVK